MLSLITGMPSLLDGSAQFYDTNVNLGGTATPADLVLLGDARPVRDDARVDRAEGLAHGAP